MTIDGSNPERIPSKNISRRLINNALRFILKETPDNISDLFMPKIAMEEISIDSKPPRNIIIIVSNKNC